MHRRYMCALSIHVHICTFFHHLIKFIIFIKHCHVIIHGNTVIEVVNKSFVYGTLYFVAFDDYSGLGVETEADPRRSTCGFLRNAFSFNW